MKAMAFATITAIREVLAGALVLPSGSVSAEEGVSIRVKIIRESILVPTEFSTPSKGGVLPVVTQT